MLNYQRVGWFYQSSLPFGPDLFFDQKQSCSSLESNNFWRRIRFCLVNHCKSSLFMTFFGTSAPQPQLGSAGPIPPPVPWPSPEKNVKALQGLWATLVQNNFGIFDTVWTKKRKLPNAYFFDCSKYSTVPAVFASPFSILFNMLKSQMPSHKNMLLVVDQNVSWINTQPNEQPPRLNQP